MQQKDALGWTLTDYQALKDLETHQGAPAEWFAAVQYRESDMNPAAKNALGFRGLIQFSVQNLKDYGLSDAQIDKFTTWTPAKQMKYVDRFYRSWRPATGWESRAQIYQATYMPGTIKWKGSAPTTILAKKGSQEYDLNTGLDVGHKGYITVGDLESVIQTRLDRDDSLWIYALAGIDAAGGSVDPNSVAQLERTGLLNQERAILTAPPSSRGAVAATFAGAVLLALGGYYAFQNRRYA